jgi:hypothetical protein
LQFLRAEEFEELLLAWMHTILEHGSLSLILQILVPDQNFGLVIVCLPNAVFNEQKFIINTNIMKMQAAH